jgi:hypothetical protein
MNRYIYTTAVCLLVLTIGLPACKMVSPQRILTKYDWQIDEQLADLSGTTYHYKRGGENTFSYDQACVLFTFNKDSTGTYTDPDTNTYKLHWYFKTGNDIVLNFDAPWWLGTSHWNLLTITDSSLSVSSAVSNGLVSTRLVPVIKKKK